MANIWKQNKDVTQKVKRNNHDLSYDNHATFKMGYLYPVFRKAVVPGDSFRIRSAFDLKMMPLVFPLQTRMRAHLHFFYVRYKNVWKDFEDYMTGVHRNTPLVEPYVAPDDEKVVTGSLYDFLGVPTTLVAKDVVSSVIHPYADKSNNPILYMKSLSVGTNVDAISDEYNSSSYILPCFRFNGLKVAPEENYFNVGDFGDYLTDMFTQVDPTGYLLLLVKPDTNDVIRLNNSIACSFDGAKVIWDDTVFTKSDIANLINLYGSIDFLLVSNVSGEIAIPSLPALPVSDYDIVFPDVIPTAGFKEYKDLNLGLYKNHLHLKAMPFRVYESVYRSYYANDVLQPLIDGNGDAQYNKFCTTQEGGLDTTDYHLFKRNYELDFLTSAYPSPQAGPAPLVGISALGNITIEDENGITTAKAEVDDDGHVTSVSITSPLASIEHGRTLVNIAQAGININDFRNANALQKFLEQTLRSGYRYIDFIRGQWGVKPKDQALDMPEFLGGFSRDVVIQTIISLADTGSSSLSDTLGGFGANGRVIGGSDFSVNKFCDDYGEIIGVMCVTPTPAYSQLLDKSMIVGDNYLSFPFPQFNQLGMQPIPYKEVAPIQAYIDMLEDPSKSLEDTFGYQRPNYNLVGSVDEVHGEFRGSLRQYLINRIFDGRPELSSSFLEIDPSEVNDVFVNQDPDDDVLIGHLRFKVDTKRPFPRIHMPGL